VDIDVSAVTSHFPNPQDGFTTTTSGSVSSAATTVGLSGTGNYDNGDIVVLIIDPTDSNKKQVFVGTIDISGSQVTGVVWVGGTNQSHSSGATVVDYYDAAHVKMMTKGILVHADQDGTLKSGAVDNSAVLGNDVVTTSKMIDGAVTTPKVTDAAITAAKMVYGMVRQRQGGAAGDATWQTQGTTNVDTSAKNVFTQVGVKVCPNTAGADTAVSFPVAFNFAPIVFTIPQTQATANQQTLVNTVTATGFNIRTLITAAGSENVGWLAIGQ
jgi:hypothetical protein